MLAVCNLIICNMASKDLDISKILEADKNQGVRNSNIKNLFLSRVI
jgi:hypothetical protein